MSGALLGTLSPAAVAVPDGRRIAYTAAEGLRPVVRILDVESGDESVLDEGALSAAWREDGAVAYFKALVPELDDPREYRGHLVVRPSPDVAPVRWTRAPGRYVAAAWAGSRLFAYRLGDASPMLLLAEGPGRLRELGRSGLVAVSPEGDRVVVSEFRAVPPVVALLDAASGRELARATVDELAWVAESGSWRDDLVVAAASGGIALFRVDEGSVRLDGTLALEGPELPRAVSEPQLEGGRRVVAWGELESRPGQAFPDVAFVECELDTQACRSLRRLSSTLGPRPVYNPSRPLSALRRG